MREKLTENGIHSRKGAKGAKKTKYLIEIETQTNCVKGNSLKTGCFSFAFLACFARNCFFWVFFRAQ